MLVELGSAFDRVRSSWLAVQVAALALNAACQDVRTTPGLGSAATAIDDGTGGRLKITLKGPG